MDVSKEYIQMCDCPEIHSEWLPISGDLFYASKPHDEVKLVIKSLRNSPYDVYFLKTDAKNEFYHDRVVWLPRQDQLQDMVKEDIYYSVWNFYEFCMGEIEPNSGKSMEQLWLAFYMQEKHSLKWKEGRWV